MGIEDIRDALVIRERSTFFLTDPKGNVPAGNRQGFGVYHADTRHLSTYDFSLSGLDPVTLLSTAEVGHAMEQVLTNPTFITREGRTINRGSTEIRRQRSIADILEERVRVTNFNPFAVTLDLRYEFGADFADIFDVRGYQRERAGRLHEPIVEERAIEFGYTGIDGVEHGTRIEFDVKPEHIDARSALFRLTLGRRETESLRVRIDVDHHGKRAPKVDRLEVVAEQYERWFQTSTQIFTDNEFFNRVMTRALADVRMLWSENERGESYPAAGTPWFDALFGRDSCIVSMQLLAYRPEIAKACLRLLAKWQGKEVEPARDEEPGKILHEMRFDELSRAGELPYAPYYGSIDSTPLFLMLVAEYFSWTADVRLVRELLPAIRAAIQWMEVYGDNNGDGYIDYHKRSTKGLVNQGWKDSWDAVVHADGTLARPPIALAEVQGYVYAARSRLAPVLERVGEAKTATRLRRDAKRLYQRFNEDFWLPHQHFAAMALDGDRRHVESVTTNPAHCMWTGLLAPEHSEELTTRLLANDLFSGWGLRTLTAGNPRFNPIGYHLGSVWPHDNSIVAMGFKMYGHDSELSEVMTALFDAATAFPYFRLPELFGGQSRSAHHAPVPYPVACNPQSWSAGAFPLMTQAMLGIKAEAPERRLRIVNPHLPYWLNSVLVRGLRVGNGEVTLQYRRDGGSTRVEVLEATAGIDVVMSGAWPL
jgi:glycogen debranching enzyme